MKKSYYGDIMCLVVLSPRVIALGAAEETHLALVSGTELAEPPDCQVVFTLGTLDLDRGHRLHLFPLIIHNHDLLFPAL